MAFLLPHAHSITARWILPVALATCSLALHGCSGGATPGHDAAVATDAEDRATSADVPPACPPHTHETAPGQCDATLRFEESAMIPVARDHHATAIVESAAGARLIVTGGAAIPAGGGTQAPIADVSVAEVRADGSLGAWQAGTALPGPRAGHAIGVIEDTVVVVAGRSAPTFLATSALARVQADGTLSAWERGPSLPASRFHTAGAVHGRWMYVSGGLGIVTGATVEARPEVWGAQLGVDGTLGSWQVMTALPEGLSHHASFVRGDYLYVVGGLGGDPFTNNSDERRAVLRSRIAGDGTLGAWERVNELPLWLSTHAASTHHDWLYVFGGVADSAENSDQVFRARWQEGGALGPWEASATRLPAPRAHLHQAPARDGRVYLVSGSMEPHTPVNTTLIGVFE